MTTAIEMVDEIPMPAHYDSHSSAQMEANTWNLQSLTQALLAVSPLSPTITVADFGSATGLNSMKTFSAAIKEFRETSQKEIFVFHTDLPDNAWNVLFKNAAVSPHSYLTIPGISGIGINYVNRLFPSHFLSIGYSTFTLHWLSRRASCPQQLQRFCAGDPQLYTELAAIARDDLDTFLKRRAEELRVGGRLLIVSLVGKLDIVCFYEALAGMMASGICTSAPLDSMLVPWYIRSEEEFLDGVRKVPQFRVVAKALKEDADPMFRKYREDGDLDAYAQASELFLRGASETLFRSVLSQDDALVEEFYRRTRACFRERPCLTYDKQLHLVLERIA